MAELFNNSDEKKLNDAADKAADDALAVFGEIVEKKWKDKTRPLTAYDYIVLAKIVSVFLGFGYHTFLRTAGDREAADRWLQMAMELMEAEIGGIAKAEVRFPVVWKGRRA